MLLCYAIISYAQQQEKSCDAACCFRDISPAGLTATHTLPQKRWMASYRYMQMPMGSFYSGNTRVSQEKIFTDYLMSSDKMRMDMHMLMLMYGLTDRFTWMAMMNYNLVSMNMKSLPGSGHMHGNFLNDNPEETIKNHGPGDIKLYTISTLFRSLQHRLDFIGGISIPVGKINYTGSSGSMYADQRLTYCMQMGSGTWDALPGINYSFEKKNISAGGQVTSVLRTGNNHLNYRLGHEISFTTWAACRWWNAFSGSLRIEALNTGKIMGKDVAIYAFNEPSANPLNYGGSKVTGFAGLSYFIQGGILHNSKPSIELGIPLYQQLNGLQMKTKYMLYASWNYVF